MGQKPSVSAPGIVRAAALLLIARRFHKADSGSAGCAAANVRRQAIAATGTECQTTAKSDGSTAAGDPDGKPARCHSRAAVLSRIDRESSVQAVLREWRTEADALREQTAASDRRVRESERVSLAVDEIEWPLAAAGRHPCRPVPAAELGALGLTCGELRTAGWPALDLYQQLLLAAVWECVPTSRMAGTGAGAGHRRARGGWRTGPSGRADDAARQPRCG